MHHISYTYRPGSKYSVRYSPQQLTRYLICHARYWPAGVTSGQCQPRQSVPTAPGTICSCRLWGFVRRSIGSRRSSVVSGLRRGGWRDVLVVDLLSWKTQTTCLRACLSRCQHVLNGVTDRSKVPTYFGKIFNAGSHKLNARSTSVRGKSHAVVVFFVTTNLGCEK